MNHTPQHSAAWVAFTYISFAASAFMVWATAGPAASKRATAAADRAIIVIPPPIASPRPFASAVNHANQAQACPSFAAES